MSESQTFWGTLRLTGGDQLTGHGLLRLSLCTYVSRSTVSEITLQLSAPTRALYVRMQVFQTNQYNSHNLLHLVGAV